MQFYFRDEPFGHNSGQTYRTAHIAKEGDASQMVSLCRVQLSPKKWLLVEQLPEQTHLCLRCQQLASLLAPKIVDHYVLYQDIEDRPRQVFTMMTPPSEERLMEPQVVPHWKVNEPVYIRWHQRDLEGIRLQLLTYTHKDLEDREVEDLLEKALRFIQEQ